MKWMSLDRPQPKQPKPEPRAVDRRGLKKQLSDCGAAEAHRDEILLSLTASGAALDEAVEVHQQSTRKIQADLADCTNPVERQALLAARDAANDALDKTCAKLRPRISQLQTESCLAIHAVPHRALIEKQLMASASEEARQRHFHAQQNLEWTEVRRATAKKSLATAVMMAERNDNNGSQSERDTSVLYWQAEVEDLQDLFESAIAELAALRQELIEE